ncbi:MAG: response regulator [Anaerolineae bacterium]|nr:response regulator [Anaerolineae bacterium]
MNVDFSNRALRVLLVDDDKDDFILIRDLLASLEDISIEVDWAGTYDEAFQTLLRNEHDLCLLDYFLGEHNGIELLKGVRAAGCMVPFILLTGRGNRAVDLEAMKGGVDYYVDKKQLDIFDLERAMRYSLERAHILHALQDANAQLEERVADRTRLLREANKQLEAEMKERLKAEAELNQLRQARQSQTLEKIARPPQTTVTAQLLGVKTLREAEPKIFDQLTERYDELMDLALEQFVYRVDHNISEQRRELAEIMGSLRLSARDVVEIHNAVLKSKGKSKRITPERAESYLEEGRFMILEVLGYLASYYRNFATGKGHLA